MIQMLYYLKGLNGQIEVYEDRVIINRKGFLAKGAIGLAGSKTIPINAIQTVQFREGTSLYNGFIQFGVLGGIEARGGLQAAITDENSVIIKKKHNEQAREIKNFIENKILSKYETSDTNKYESISIADDIIKYKQLLDEGIITQQEFDRKKEELLKL